MRGLNQKKIPIARKLRRYSTSAESTLWAELRNRQLDGFKFVRQTPIGGYVVDFVCREALLVVEVDGATHSTSEEIERDTIRTSFLEGLGYSVIRVQNDDVYNAMEGVLRTIQLGLESSGKMTKRPLTLPMLCIGSLPLPAKAGRGHKQKHCTRASPLPYKSRFW